MIICNFYRMMTTITNSNNITNNSRLHRSAPQLSPQTSAQNSHRCIATIKGITLNIMLQRCRSLVRAARRGRERGGPHHQTSPNHHIVVVSIVQTPWHRSSYPCPTNVPHLPPPQPLLSLAVVFHVILYLVEVVLAINLNVLLLLVLLIRSLFLCPSPSFCRALVVFSSSWHAAHPVPLPSFCYCFACSHHMQEYTNHVNWPLVSPHHGYEPLTSLRTSDGLTWSNGGVRW